MPCYFPLHGYATIGGQITFKRSEAFFPDQPMQLPCGRCIGCKLQKSKDWALRCYHEAQLNDTGLNNCYITLTYRDADLPENGCLKKSDFQKFIKRLRNNTKQKIRYFMCGEYGDKTNRPHYHALLFGYKFPDAKFWTERKGNRIYKSEILETTWKHGHTELSGVTYKSAAYVARYILKKQNSCDATQDRYCIYDKETGEVTLRPFEYVAMSLKPGIGFDFYHKYPDSFFPQDEARLPDGGTTPVPKYYRTLLERSNPKLAEQLRKARIAKLTSDPNNTPERLAVRCSNAEIRQKQQPRDFL